VCRLFCLSGTSSLLLDELFLRRHRPQASGQLPVRRVRVPPGGLLSQIPFRDPLSLKASRERIASGAGLLKLAFEIGAGLGHG
jgi:hypothetical protein